MEQSRENVNTTRLCRRNRSNVNQHMHIQSERLTLKPAHGYSERTAGVRNRTSPLILTCTNLKQHMIMGERAREVLKQTMCM